MAVCDDSFCIAVGFRERDDLGMGLVLYVLVAHCFGEGDFAMLDFSLLYLPQASSACAESGAAPPSLSLFPLILPFTRLRDKSH